MESEHRFRENVARVDRLIADLRACIERMDLRDGRDGERASGDVVGRSSGRSASTSAGGARGDSRTPSPTYVRPRGAA